MTGGKGDNWLVLEGIVYSVQSRILGGKRLKSDKYPEYDVSTRMALYTFHPRPHDAGQVHISLGSGELDEIPMTCGALLVRCGWA